MTQEISDLAGAVAAIPSGEPDATGASKPSNVRISVVIPTFNAAATLAATLVSIRVQKFAAHDVIVVDGGSTDATLAIANEAGDVVTEIISEPDQGIYDAMNKGCARTRGDLIVVLGADDCLTPVAFEQVDIAWRANKADIYAGRAIMVALDGAETLREDEEFGIGALVSGIPFNHNSMFATREAYRRVGGYALEFRLAADAHWVHRAILAGLAFQRINAPLVRFGLDGASSQAGERIFAESAAVICATFPFLSAAEAETMLRVARGWLPAADAEPIIARHLRHDQFVGAAQAALQARKARGSERIPVPSINEMPREVLFRTPPERGIRAAEPQLSFIIPAYNVERYIERCLDSILDQAIIEFEIIVIDDGSTDGTAEILRRYADADDRIRVFTCKNGGQGAARSFGIQAAKGRYVWFVDSDDWLLEGAGARVSRLLSAIDPDVVVLNFEYAFDDRPPLPSSRVPPHLAGRFIDPLESPATFSTVSCWSVPPWRLLTRRALLIEQHIRFAEGVFYEDHPFAIKLMLVAQRVYVDASLSYAYYQRATSTTHVSDSKAFDFIRVRRECLDLFRSFGVEQWLAPIVTSYLAPSGFFDAHVAAEHQSQFLWQLNDDFADAEIAFVRAHGASQEQRFLAAVQAGDPQLLQSDTDRQGGRRVAAVVKAVPFLRRTQQRVRSVLKNPGPILRRAWNGLLRRVRAAIWRALGLWTLQAEFRAFASPSAPTPAPAPVPDPRVKFDEGVRNEGIHLDVRVRPEERTYLTVGAHSHIGGQYVFERGVGEISIGARSSIGGGCLFVVSQPDGIRIGDRVMVSWKCTLIDSDSHSLDPDVRAADAYNWKASVDAGQMGAFKDWSGVKSAPIVIEDDAWIGFESVIMKGVTIGKGAVVAARSVVTKDVAPYNIVGGSPARFVGLARRQKWSWEEIIAAAQGDPSQQQLLVDAFMHRDSRAMLRRYRESEEFRDTVALARLHSDAKTLLEVGGSNAVISTACALEGISATLVEPSDSPIVGVGGARRMVKMAKAIDPSVGDRVRIIRGLIETARIDEQFDIVICRQVVHHFEDPVVALRRIHALTKPNGVVMLIREHVIFDDDDNARFLEHHPFHKHYSGEKAFQPEQYEAFALEAGFDVIQTLAFKESPINYFPHTAQTISTIPESEFPGRPYSFILKPKPAP